MDIKKELLEIIIKKKAIAEELNRELEILLAAFISLTAINMNNHEKESRVSEEMTKIMEEIFEAMEKEKDKMKPEQREKYEEIKKESQDFFKKKR